MNTNMTKTTNGMAALKTSFNANVDLFAKIGSARGTDLSNLFRLAFAENQDFAVRNILWGRDVRGGAGERQTFRSLMNQVVRECPIDVAARIISKIPEVGRWDDMFKLIGLHPTLDDLIAETVAQALLDKNGLCAKWMPREKSANSGHAHFFMRKFDMSSRTYRKLIVSLTNVVEQKMCGDEWEKIDFGKIPSIAAKNYQRAFKRNVPELYQEYVDGLATGKTKINAGAIFPYDVIRGLNGVNGVADAQWKALPDYMEGSTENLLCVVDTSASMECAASAGLTCMEIAVSLGLYVSERSKGLFKDKFITFDTNPEFVDLSNCTSLAQRVTKAKGAKWGGSTDIEKTFKLLLTTAIKHNVDEGGMPTKILIFSDMQFNRVEGHRGHDWSASKTAYQMIDEMYARAGYKRPDIIFWNLNANCGNLPVTFGAGGSAMVSGFSPAVMKAILSTKEVPEITPLSMMIDAIGVDRYNW